MTGFEVTSASNPRMKRLISFSKRSNRDAEGVFLVEGARLFGRAVAAGWEPLEIYTDGSVDVDRPGATSVHPAVLDRVSYRKHSEGVIAVFAQRRIALTDLRVDPPGLVLVADSVEKPGNLGAILRTADAVGADGVVELGDPDLFNPNLLRASTGACFTVPIVSTTATELAPWLKGHGMSLVAAEVDAPTSLWEVDLTGPVALAVGAEDSGLGQTIRAMADSLASIPMVGTVDSLNASTALALLAYEAVRQRR